jgi:hypothetical protein
LKKISSFARNVSYKMGFPPAQVCNLKDKAIARMAARFLVTVILVALAFSSSYAHDPSPLQDFCVAINDPKDAGKNIAPIYVVSLRL